MASQISHLISFLIEHAWPTGFWAVGLSFSIYYGLFAPNIFWSAEEIKNNFKGTHGSFKRIHQFWVNFACSLAGWVAIYLFLKVLHEVKPSELSIAEFLLLIFGLVGVIGWLPWVLWDIAGSIKAIGKKILDLGVPKN